MPSTTKLSLTPPEAPTDTFSFLDRKDRRNGKYPDNWVQTIDGDGKGNVWVLLLACFLLHWECSLRWDVASCRHLTKVRLRSM